MILVANDLNIAVNTNLLVYAHRKESHVYQSAFAREGGLTIRYFYYRLSGNQPLGSTPRSRLSRRS